MSAISSYLDHDARRDALAWQAVSAVAATLGALAARSILKAGWRHVHDREPPQNPAEKEVDWQDALIFGLITGALAGLARIASRHAAAAGWSRWRG